MTPLFKATLLCLAFIASFYGFSYLCFRESFGKGFIRKKFSKKQRIILWVTLAIEILIGVFTISRNNSVYTFDSAGYWSWSYKHMLTLFSSPHEGLENLFESIINTDYNLILPTIIALPLKVIGYTFSRYNFANFCLFTIPSFFISICLARKVFILKEHRKKSEWFVVFLAVSILFTVKSSAVFHGYIDEAIMIPILLIASFVIDYEPTRSLKNNAKTNLLLSLLLVMAFLFRRYTAFLIVSFFITITILSFLRILFSKEEKSKKRADFKDAFLNIFMIGGTALLIMLVFFGGLIFRILSDNYSILYSAYNESLFGNIILFVKRYGVIIIAISTIGVISAFKKDSFAKTNRFSSLCVLSTIALFFTVQNINDHHTLAITPLLSIPYMIGILRIINSSRRYRKIISFIIVILLILEIPFCYSSKTLPGQILFAQNYAPLRRSDLNTLHEIADYINAINNGEETYVLASSIDFNHDTLSNLEMPCKDSAINNLHLTYQVDLRDGFPDPLMTSHYIVVALPAQTHLKEGSQETIRYFTELITDSNSYFGRHFEKDEREFIIEKNIKILIYRKKSAFSQADYAEMLDYFTNLYPDSDEIFKNRIEQYM